MLEIMLNFIFNVNYVIVNYLTYSF